MNGGRTSEYTRVERLESGVVETSTAALSTNGVRSWLRGSMSMHPCRLRRRKIGKFGYELVHSKVYLNKYVASIEPFS